MSNCWHCMLKLPLVMPLLHRHPYGLHCQQMCSPHKLIAALPAGQLLLCEGEVVAAAKQHDKFQNCVSKGSWHATYT